MAGHLVASGEASARPMSKGNASNSTYWRGTTVYWWTCAVGRAVDGGMHHERVGRAPLGSGADDLRRGLVQALGKRWAEGGATLDGELVQTPNLGLEGSISFLRGGRLVAVKLAEGRQGGRVYMLRTLGTILTHKFMCPR